MGDDNEIRQIVRRESEQFLDAAWKASGGTGAVYDLEEEFGKTRRNRSFMVWGITLLTIAALGAAAFSATALIKRQTAAMPVDVQAFQDLNLKELLDRAKRDEAELEQARVDLARVQGERQAALDAVARDLSASVETIKARGYKAAEEQARLAQAAAQAGAQRKTIEARYAQPLAQRLAAVKASQERVDGYNERMGEQTRRQQEALDNQNRLFEMEKARLVASYSGQVQDLKSVIKRDEAALKRQREELASSLTARWNPIWDDGRSQDLLGGWKADPAAIRIPDAALSAGLFSSGSLSRADATEADASMERLLFLSAQLRSVPYLNSVPPALARLEYEARLSFSTWRSALNRAGSAIDDRERQIADLRARLSSAESSLDHYRWAASQYVLENRDAGYILDARDPDAIVIALNPAVPLPEGGSGTVVRPGGKAIATLSLFGRDGQAMARVVRLQDGETLKAFDPIIVFVSAPSAAGTGQ